MWSEAQSVLLERVTIRKIKGPHRPAAVVTPHSLKETGLFRLR